MLFLSSKQDEIVPQEQMRRLYALTEKGENRRKWVEIEQAAHNDACLFTEYWDNIRIFWLDSIINDISIYAVPW